MELIYLTITLGVYVLNQKIQKKTKWVFYNPLLITSILIMIFFYFNTSHFDSYMENTKVLSWLITPATVALAIPLYKNKAVIQENFKALVLGIFTAITSHALILTLLYKLLRTDTLVLASLVPKSVTTAIAKDVALSLGGEPNITIPVVIITGIIGAILSESMRKVFNIKSDKAHGLALGACAHAVGTSKALEEGEMQAVFASIALVLTGLLTAALAPLIFALIA